MWPLEKLVAVNAILGVVGGVISGTLYALKNFGDESLLSLLVVFFLAPIVQALMLCLYTLVGFPVVKKLVEKGKISIS